MDSFDDLRLREREQVVQALEVTAPLSEPLAAIGPFIELVLLHHRAHRAVEDNDAFAQQTLQSLSSICLWLHSVKVCQTFGPTSSSGRGQSKYHFIMI